MIEFGGIAPMANMTQGSDKAGADGKAVYVAPRLIVHGSALKLTAGGSGNASEGCGGNCKPRP